ncbi:subunit of TIM23 translocase complex [Malassezia psittaci]|uniref:Subunit of TIM23 translocase complex n=1 Tax=Malassezia psittaci TaxID=1821823 RepID=A0AAF0FAB8_9BASI|nr:subunit of TIM23 translocase complex [Malassezia psittaci]
MSLPQQPQQQVILQQAAEPTALSNNYGRHDGLPRGTYDWLYWWWIPNITVSLRHLPSAGPGPRGALATLSQYMLSSGATFGFFMSIGSVLRTESTLKNEAQWQAAFRAQDNRVFITERLRKLQNNTN